MSEHAPRSGRTQRRGSDPRVDRGQSSARLGDVAADSPLSIPPVMVAETTVLDPMHTMDEPKGTELTNDAPNPSATPPTTGSTPTYEALHTGAIPITPPVTRASRTPEQASQIARDWATLLSQDEQEGMDALHDWWADLAQKDAESCLAKLYEYGSSDFDIMAQSMIAVGGSAWSGASDVDKARIGREMAVLFYLQGKVARAFGALQKGRVPSNDTYDDITRYSMILRRIRETGKWDA